MFFTYDISGKSEVSGVIIYLITIFLFSCFGRNFSLYNCVYSCHWRWTFCIRSKFINPFFCPRFKIVCLRIYTLIQIYSTIRIILWKHKANTIKTYFFICLKCLFKSTPCRKVCCMCLSPICLIRRFSSFSLPGTFSILKITHWGNSLSSSEIFSGKRLDFFTVLSLCKYMTLLICHQKALKCL